MTERHILIVDDDYLNRRLIKKTLIEHNFGVFEAKNVATGIDFLQNESIDLAILDINLGENEQNGISLGKQIKENFRVPFIYLTAYDNPKIISEAIGTSPYSYLTKPFKNSDLIAAVQIALLTSESKQNQEATLLVKDGEYKVEILLNEINYIESEGNYLLIHADTKTFKYRSTISQILDLLPSGTFIQTHRAFVVHKEKIEKYNTQYVFVNDVAIPVSKKYQSHF